MITNPQSGTRIDEIEAGLFRISTPVPATVIPGGFTFNQFLIVDDEPVLFHTGPRAMFPLVRQAITKVLDPSMLRWIAFSHVEADECGGLELLLEAAPRAQTLTGTNARMLWLDDQGRAGRGLADGEAMSIGTHRVRWLDAPHLPHNWECGYLFEETTRTLLCGDLFTQPGDVHEPTTEGDILGPSEAMRAALPYFSGGPQTRARLEHLARTEPRTLACMHGSSYRGDGAKLLHAFADEVTRDAQ